jgi:hypothetical protein
MATKTRTPPAAAVAAAGGDYRERTLSTLFVLLPASHPTT